MASRSTRAIVCRIIAWMAGSKPAASCRAVREVLEACVFLDERELHGPGRAVALFADDDLGDPFDPLLGLAVLGPVLLGPEDEHHDVGVLLQRPRFTQVRELRP